MNPQIPILSKEEKEAAIQETGRQIAEGCPSQYIHDTNRMGRVVGGCPSVRQSGRRATIEIVSTAQFQSNTPAPSVTSTWLSYQRAIDNIAKYPQVQAHMTQRVHVTSGVKRMVRVMPNPRYIRPRGLHPLPLAPRRSRQAGETPYWTKFERLARTAEEAASEDNPDETSPPRRSPPRR